MAAVDLYDKDYYAWANETARSILEGNFSGIDLGALAEEVADIARKEKRALRSRFEVLISHLLKWDYQSGKRTRSWAATIAIQRRSVLELLKDSPSLAPWVSENLPDFYEGGVQLAVQETNTGEEGFPGVCPYSLDEILSGKLVAF